MAQGCMTAATSRPRSPHRVLLGLVTAKLSRRPTTIAARKPHVGGRDTTLGVPVGRSRDGKRHGRRAGLSVETGLPVEGRGKACRAPHEPPPSRSAPSVSVSRLRLPPRGPHRSSLAAHPVDRIPDRGRRVGISVTIRKRIRPLDSGLMQTDARARRAADWPRGAAFSTISS
jgi:hypothetical protein